MTFDVKTFDVTKYNELLDAGLSMGLGIPEVGKMCIEAAICNVMGLAHSDDPKCVAITVRTFKIRLNDFNWSSNLARANGLRELGLAQLGSLDIVNDVEFTKLLSSKIIKVLIPDLFRRIFPDNERCLEAARLCGIEGTANAATNAANAANAASCAANAAHASYAAASASCAAHASYAADAAHASYAAASASCAAHASYAANEADYYLILAANLALETLKELNSPGCALLT